MTAAGGSPFRTLPLDRRNESAVAALRLTAAAMVTASAIWLAQLRPNPLVWACVGASVLAAVAWLVMGLRARRRVRDAARHRLVLAPEALHLVEGAREWHVAWADVEQVETDEERLVVRIAVREGDPLAIEPRYGGLGVHDLETAVRRALDAARGGSRPLQGAPL